MFIICPRIDIPDPRKEMALNVKSVKEEAKRLKEDVFQEFEIEILHSKIKPKRKEEIMSRFANGEIDILVSTSVVEVGVNVPNATMIIIEGAERFGLAQLHQLRGRVLKWASGILLYFYRNKVKTSIDRLNVLKTAKRVWTRRKGFNAPRFGTTWWRKTMGYFRYIGMEAIRYIKWLKPHVWKHTKLLKRFELKNYPLLKEKMGRKDGEIHFE